MNPLSLQRIIGANSNLFCGRHCTQDRRGSESRLARRERYAMQTRTCSAGGIVRRTGGVQSPVWLGIKHCVGARTKLDPASPLRLEREASDEPKGSAFSPIHQRELPRGRVGPEFRLARDRHRPSRPHSSTEPAGKPARPDSPSRGSPREPGRAAGSPRASRSRGAAIPDPNSGMSPPPWERRRRRGRCP